MVLLHSIVVLVHIKKKNLRRLQEKAAAASHSSVRSSRFPFFQLSLQDVGLKGDQVVVGQVGDIRFCVLIDQFFFI